MKMYKLGRLAVATVVSAALVLPLNSVLAQQKTLKETIVGTWTITSVYDQYEDGKKVNPWGAGVKGEHVFGSDGSYIQTLIGEPRADMKSDDPRRADAYVVVLLGRYNVDEANKTITYKVERAANSMRNGADQSLAVSINGDDASFVGSPRKDQNGTFSPHMEVKRFK
jgi:Lipocalin-like domain